MSGAGGPPSGPAPAPVSAPVSAAGGVRAFLTRLPESRDLAIGILLFLVVILMILPIPTPVVDALIGLNFGIAFLLMMTAVYLATPLNLSSLPGIILISTVFRLALSISTTRLILAEGDAGRIVETFGAIVVAGNVVVGLVVFFIITIVQFLVIAKGAERIAEVSARFTLDALPGKQMSIDAELRNGDIDNVEASARRSLLERESQFFGAMDGALKFVKGDAIAGLIIILVNLVGGLTIGMVQFGMPLGAAARKYTLLTVGDALISQIPALLIAITAAVIVTRVKGPKQRNLGVDIFAQIAGDRRAMLMAAGSLTVMGLIPGFPTAILLAVAAVFAVAGLAIRRPAPEAEAQAAPEEEAPAPEAAADAPPALVPPSEAQAVVELSRAIWDRLEEADLARRAHAVAAAAAKATGIAPCRVSVRADDTLEPAEFRLAIDGVPHLWSSVDMDAVHTDDVPAVLDMHAIPWRPAPVSLWSRHLAVDADRAGDLASAGLPVRSGADVIFAQAGDALVRNIGQLIGVQETKDILAGIEAEAPFLVGECARHLPLPKVAEVFRRLLDERVALTNKRRILEALVEWGPSEQSPLALAEYCRVALRQQLCEAASDRSRVIASLVVERETEDTLRASLRETGIGTFLVLPEAASAGLLEEVRRQVGALSPRGTRPVVMTSMDVRRHLRTFLGRNGIEIDVMSFQELSDDYTVVPCATLRLGAAARGAAPATRIPTEERET